MHDALVHGEGNQTVSVLNHFKKPYQFKRGDWVWLHGNNWWKYWGIGRYLADMNNGRGTCNIAVLYYETNYVFPTGHAVYFNERDIMLIREQKIIRLLREKFKNLGEYDPVGQADRAVAIYNLITEYYG